MRVSLEAGQMCIDGARFWYQNLEEETSSNPSSNPNYNYDNDAWV